MGGGGGFRNLHRSPLGTSGERRPAAAVVAEAPPVWWSSSCGSVSMATAAARQRRSPPGAAEGEPEAKRTRPLEPSESAGGRRRVVLNPADCDLGMPPRPPSLSLSVLPYWNSDREFPLFILLRIPSFLLHLTIRVKILGVRSEYPCAWESSWR